jgi:uncharacterized CHY-type Zn-finger protein
LKQNVATLIAIIFTGINNFFTCFKLVNHLAVKASRALKKTDFSGKIVLLKVHFNILNRLAFNRILEPIIFNHAIYSILPLFNNV